MSRSSRNWPSRLASLLVLGGVVTGGAAGAAPNPNITAGEQAAQQFLQGRFDSREAIGDNAVKPLQGQTLMTDQQGIQFSASLACTAATPMVSVFGVPGATGDLQTVILSADTDLDGTTDVTLTPGIPVSGVCSNGYIGCDVGTWNNCTYWKWDAAAGLQAVPTSVTDLIGCYCLNNSCGSSLVWNNLEQVLRDIGSGAIGALQQNDARFMIAEARLNNTQLDIYGADQLACVQGPATQQGYLSNPSQMGVDANQQVAAQSSVSTSIYSVVSGSGAATGAATTFNSCVITRSVPVDSACVIQTDLIQDGCQTLAANPACRLKEEVVDGVITYQNYTPTNLVPLPSQRVVTSASGTYPVTTQKIIYIGSHGYIYQTYPTPFVSITNAVIATQYSRSACIYNYSYGWNGNVLWAHHGCRADMRVTGIELRPCGHTVTRNWWYKQQTWACQGNAPSFNFDDALYRTSVAQSSASLSGGFTETHKDASGNWTSTQIAIGQPADLPVVPSCRPMCKLAKQVADDRVTALDVTASVRSSPGTKTVFRYAECDASNTCPAQAGETIEQSCQCLDEFAEAASIMQMMRQAAQDLICSP